MKFETVDIILKNSKKVTVREAVPEDADALIRAAKTYLSTSEFLCSYEDEFNPTEQEEKSWIDAHQAENSLLLVATYKDEILCTFNATGFQNKKMYHVAVLGISILEEWRGMGLGKAMFDLLISWAKSSPLQMLVLEVFAENINAIHLYEKYGFKVDGIRKGYFKNADGVCHDNILMSLNLK